MSTASKPAPGTTAPPSESMLLPAILTAVTIIAVVIILRIPPLSQPWSQGYDPTGHWWLSTLVASVPVIVLLERWHFI